MSKLILNIDRLVLDGVPLSRAESLAMGEALESELGTLVSAGGLNHRDLSARLQHPLSVDPLTLDRAAGPAAWGRQVAQSVYGSLASQATRSGTGGKRR